MPAIFRYADDVGDGTGNINVTGDYSSAADDFIVQCRAGEQKLEIHRLIVYIEDSGGVTAGTYGAVAGGLTNGISILHKRGATETDLTDGLPITNNGQWSRLCYDAALRSWGAGNAQLLVRWTFSLSGAPITVTGSESEQLIVRVNDNLTGLIDHTFMFQGVATLTP